ncbi:mannitol dehydrogenase family protein [Mycobacterium sherrisii]|uniref:Mannitol dehydrogenase n=1 Tax=Mycobacterium sherrisii TaxID=243061 RepID=A0A1E3T9N2_9MYCO|nr:mannitol dehydrogenase family protein [Mycobacterium sherrisii]MCV7031622.1 mannitol dehydrogenase family protein [Mycobacterium sherrisii]MEC4764993.1 mannitol dehydrogenase family protein [Mycobacterium sherrisii]ODR11015.1 mannitol dehydrogenase [Mycobacterium sherrisii]ORW86087.1 mannitol dehydrogenase [Mycobacterium sherrisii]
MVAGAVNLNNAALGRLSIEAPRYARDSVGVGIAHIGAGHFHRAHQAMYIERLLQQGLAQEWGICGVGVMPADWTMRDVLRDQDGLYTLILVKPDDRREAQVIGSIIDYRYAPDDPEAALAVLAAPATRIISLTITEGGYRDPDGPAFTLITEALQRRRQRGIAAPTIVSCDNIESNGEIARRAVLANAENRDPGLARWIADEARFPSSMVDRITPATTVQMAENVRRDFGVNDRWPVVAEPFAAWVLEDEFADGRPPLERAGVLLVDDVAPYELMKLRLLNAGHQCLAYFAHLCGFEFVHDAARDPLFADFLLGYFESEAIPTLPPVPGIDLHDYSRALIERFTNAGVRDTVARLCAYSSDRIPKWLVPVINDNLANDGPVRLAAAAVASWARYAEGIDEWGEPFEVVDQLADSLIPIARTQYENPTAFIEITAVFGNLAAQPAFVQAYRWALESLHDKGARATLEALVR